VSKRVEDGRRLPAVQAGMADPGDALGESMPSPCHTPMTHFHFRQLDEMLKEIDTDNSGTMDYQEFLTSRIGVQLTIRCVFHGILGDP
jgi:hypothetical protein